MKKTPNAERSEPDWHLTPNIELTATARLRESLMSGDRPLIRQNYDLQDRQNHFRRQRPCIASKQATMPLLQFGVRRSAFGVRRLLFLFLSAASVASAQELAISGYGPPTSIPVTE